MADILVSWIGIKDLRGCEQSPATGPLVSILRFHRFDCVYLLYDYQMKVVEPLFNALSEEFDCELKTRPVNIQSPIHFGDIYHELDKALTAAQADYPKGKLHIQLTSGTPTMTSVSILTGKTKYKVKFIQSTLEQGVQFVDIPFDIAADFLPALANNLDNELTTLLSGQAPSTAAFSHIVTQDPQMQRLKEKAAILAMRGVTVLIQGETGTGKELFATAIHNSSRRAKKKFVPVNCGAIPPDLIDSTLFGHEKGAFTGASASRKGVFAEADGGTLFLDEFGELPLDVQVRLLRVLTDGKYYPVGSTTEHKSDIRLVVATNRNLAEEVAEGRFREDLYYRVAIGVLNLPPVRHRKGDKWLLAEHLLNGINQEAASQPGYKEKKISAAAKKLILSHEWSGNVREMHATLVRATLWGAADKISESDMREAMLVPPTKESSVLGRDISQGIDINDIIKEVSAHYIERALAETGNSKTKAAELLGFNSYQTLNNWMKKNDVQI
ncbi:MAG: sigma 54-interacting transcriptional regulator [Pseudomonadales bacterium]|nr:sigma 54-interacting transcriptional regulator [Pseudomonadales bacterium]